MNIRIQHGQNCALLTQQTTESFQAKFVEVGTVIFSEVCQMPRSMKVDASSEFKWFVYRKWRHHRNDSPPTSFTLKNGNITAELNASSGSLVRQLISVEGFCCLCHVSWMCVCAYVHVILVYIAVTCDSSNPIEVYSTSRSIVHARCIRLSRAKYHLKQLHSI